MRTLFIWSIMSILVGVAQFTRSDIEQVIALAYIGAGVGLMISGFMKSQVAVSFGYAAMGTCFAARAITAPWISQSGSWHSLTLIMATWGGLALITMSHAYLVARGDRDAFLTRDGYGQ